MKHVIAHDLGEAGARSMTERALVHYRQRYPHAAMDLDWLDEQTAAVSVGVKGIRVNGKLIIGPRSLTFDVALPLMLKPFKQKAIDVLEREAKHWLSPERPA